MAESGELELVSADPVTLLGLTAMREARGPDWKATDQEIGATIREYQLDEDAGQHAAAGGRALRTRAAERHTRSVS
ncbi:MAG: hypothetical protein ACYTG0_11995 [Planctomycetota bacterium]